jgi:DNA-directed RNA polymerase subunit RPC12/RpoP
MSNKSEHSRTLDDEDGIFCPACGNPTTAQPDWDLVGKNYDCPHCAAKLVVVWDSFGPDDFIALEERELPDAETDDA